MFKTARTWCVAHSFEWLIGAVVAVILLPFVIILGANYGNRVVPYANDPCAYDARTPLAAHANVTEFDVTVDSLSTRWHARFLTRPDVGAAEVVCPSFTSDLVYYDAGGDADIAGTGRRVAFTDEKVASLTDTMYLRDCRGDVMFTASTGTFANKLYGSVTYTPRFEFADANGTLVAFSEQDNFLAVETRFTYRDAHDGSEVATAERADALFGDVTWHVTRAQTDHAFSSPALLTMLFAKTFYGSGNSGGGLLNFNTKKRIDTCNSLTFYSAVVIICVGGVALLLLLWWLVRMWHERASVAARTFAPPYRVRVDSK